MGAWDRVSGFAWVARQWIIAFDYPACSVLARPKLAPTLGIALKFMVLFRPESVSIGSGTVGQSPDWGQVSFDWSPLMHHSGRPVQAECVHWLRQSSALTRPVIVRIRWLNCWLVCLSECACVSMVSELFWQVESSLHNILRWVIEVRVDGELRG